MEKSPVNKYALVAGATRGAERRIAVQLGVAGATVYVTGRKTRYERSEINLPETIEETTALVDEAGGHGIAVRADHLVPDEVCALVTRITEEQFGLHVPVKNAWGSPARKVSVKRNILYLLRDSSTTNRFLSKLSRLRLSPPSPCL